MNYLALRALHNVSRLRAEDQGLTAETLVIFLRLMQLKKVHTSIKPRVSIRSCVKTSWITSSRFVFAVNPQEVPTDFLTTPCRSTTVRDTSGNSMTQFLGRVNEGGYSMM